MNKGDNFISFEPAFLAFCYSLAEGWVYDAPLPEDPSRMEGMYMSWAMKYIITLQKQIRITGFGLVFNQHCTGQSKYAKAPYLAKIFRELLGTLAEAKLQGFTSFVTKDKAADAMSDSQQFADAMSETGNNFSDNLSQCSFQLAGEC